MSEIKTKAERIRDLLIAQKLALEEELDGLQGLSAPLRAEREAIKGAIEPHIQRINELNEKIKKIEQPELGAVKLQLDAIQKALSDKVMAAVKGEQG